MRYNKQQLLNEIIEGECPECGVIGPLISHGGAKHLCDVCDKDMQELE